MTATPISHNKTFYSKLKEFYRSIGFEISEVIVEEPVKRNYIDRLAMELTENDMVITLGGTGEHLNDFAKKVMAKALKYDMEINAEAVGYLESKNPATLHKFGERLSAFPKDATLFTPAYSYTYGFGITHGGKCLVSLPNNIPDAMTMLMMSIVDYVKGFSRSGMPVVHLKLPRDNEKELDIICYELSSSTVAVISGKIHDHYIVSIASHNDCEKVKKSIEEVAYKKKEPPKVEKKSGNALNFIAASCFIVAAICFTVLGYNYINDGGILLPTMQAGVNPSSSLRAPESEVESAQAEDTPSLPEPEIHQPSSESGDSIEPLEDDAVEGSGAVSLMSEELTAYIAENSDTIGIIRIPGTEIDYPVLQAEDNEYYYERDFYKEDDIYGSIYIDYTTDLDAPSSNFVIYGPNKSDGTMFADLANYKQVEFYTEHPLVEFETIYEQSIYKVAGVMVVNSNPDQGAVYDFTRGISPTSQQEMADLGAMIKECTFIHTDLDITADDQIITLYTDTYEFMGASTVVIARKLRPEESVDVNTSVARENTNPLMPDIWYETYGGYRPGEEPPESSSEAAQSSTAQSSTAQSSAAQSSTAQSSAAQSSTTPPLPQSSQNPNTPSDGVESIEIDPAELTLTEGDAYRLDIIITPEDAEAELEWFVNNEDVVYIYEGVDFYEVEALGEGVATVTLTTEGGVKTAMKVTVLAENASQSSSSQSSSGQGSQESTEQSPPADVSGEMLSIKVNGRTVTDDAYSIVCGIVENETRGNLHSEALKAHIVATYSYVKFYNNMGQSPNVLIRSPISNEVIQAANAVLGEMIYYNGSVINAPYYSTGNGYTTNSGSVWGTDYPYLQSVESEYDYLSPYYKGTFKLNESDFADKVEYTYGIDLYDEGDPEDWVEIISYNDGDYVNEVRLGSYEVSLGGEVARNVSITGRNIREQLLDFSIRSTSFEVDYSNGVFTFTTYGYGHGVGMSQWGAHGMGLNGYTYEEILTHYYSGTEVR